VKGDFKNAVDNSCDPIGSLAVGFCNSRWWWSNPSATRGRIGGVSYQHY
jgi:hypothetical protein